MFYLSLESFLLLAWNTEVKKHIKSIHAQPLILFPYPMEALKHKGNIYIPHSIMKLC